LNEDGFEKVVIPAQAGIQSAVNWLKSLDSRLRGNDGKGRLTNFCEPSIKEGQKIWIPNAEPRNHEV
jgi:hypothetical protein